jgi:histidinol-phosphatase (PHP family)
MSSLVFPPDHHMHTARCKHADGSPEEYVQAAIAVGLPAICFTDHAPIAEGVDTKHRMSWAELPIYYKEIRALAKDYSQQIHIGVGLEVDWLPGYEKAAREACEAFPWDFLLGSVHFVQSDPPCSSWQDLIYVIRQDIDPGSDLLRRYWKAWTEAACSGLFDVMSHADIYRSIDREPHPSEIAWARAALDQLAQQDVGVEFNTSLWRKGAKECYPAKWLLEEILTRGISMTCGSDAHHAYQVGDGFEKLKRTLLQDPRVKLLDFRQASSLKRLGRGI